jgi:ribonuclease VapC
VIALDSSAIISIALDEPDAEDIFKCISSYDCLLGAPTLLETHLVLRGRSRFPPSLILDRFLLRPNVEIVDFTAQHASIACAAFDQFGRGRHPAGLNYGDCMSYAIAKHAGIPLLFKGDDFSKTDVTCVERHA